MNDCENIGPMISALVDGELSENERQSVEDHLERCSDCQGRLVRFEQLQVVARHPLSEARSPDHERWKAEIEKRTHRRRARRRWSWVATTAAAALVMATMIGFIRANRSAGPLANGRSANGSLAAGPIAMQALAQAETDDADRARELLRPLETLQIVSRQERRTYDSLLRLMELDLRALKLELKHMQLDTAQRTQLNQRIEALLQRLAEPPADDSQGATI